jgi:hypothetical protein
VVERAGLENRCTFTGTGGSNPPLSAFITPSPAPRCAPHTVPAGVCGTSTPRLKNLLNGRKRSSLVVVGCRKQLM